MVPLLMLLLLLADARACDGVSARKLRAITAAAAGCGR
jgi:hypothetical protein